MASSEMVLYSSYCIKSLETNWIKEIYLEFGIWHNKNMSNSADVTERKKGKFNWKCKDYSKNLNKIIKEIPLGKGNRVKRISSTVKLLLTEQKLPNWFLFVKTVAKWEFWKYVCHYRYRWKMVLFDKLCFAGWKIAKLF